MGLSPDRDLFRLLDAEEKVISIPESGLVISKHLAGILHLKVGDEVTVYADLVVVGRTSMRFQVSAWRRARDSEHSSRVTEAEFTFVALDADGRPRPVPVVSDERREG